MSMNVFYFEHSHLREFIETASLFSKKSNLIITTIIQRNGLYKVELEERQNLDDDVVKEFIQFISQNTSFKIT
ncbi:hypothetical protein F7018_05465 [Tenacibaculum aiptasiae]|uniref:Uncharacterized protein n=1 Tax=Tenacibaculum aiptasiae TaxID=426481 RepID=A0A7J5AQ56_9FLAO|nr:hypothetical protein [Tenacibaculum aiptasiae]KAB1159758.1 hypothetical protein F7018_05465 [Tenacibaculum aiptasiae]